MKDDPEAEALEDDAERLEQHNEELQERIEGVRSDWRAKQGDESVPGATKPPDEGQDGEGD